MQKEYIYLIILSIVSVVTIFLYLILRNRNKNMIETFSMNYAELKRGNPVYQYYPPCYDICGATRTIQDILTEINKVEQYSKLLDLYSIVLCQEKHNNSSTNKEMIEQRIADLRSMGALENNMFGSLNIVNRYNINNRLVSQFLQLVTNLIQIQINRIVTSNDIPYEIKHKIEKLNDTFYEVHYPTFEKIQFQ
jgi:hypothetical protein